MHSTKFSTQIIRQLSAWTKKSSHRAPVLLVLATVLMASAVFYARRISADTGTGSVSLTTLGSANTQNFDTLSNVAGSTTNATLPNGWYITEGGGGARDNEQYAVDTGLALLETFTATALREALNALWARCAAAHSFRSMAPSLQIIQVQPSLRSMSLTREKSGDSAQRAERIRSILRSALMPLTFLQAHIQGLQHSTSSPRTQPQLERRMATLLANAQLSVPPLPA